MSWLPWVKLPLGSASNTFLIVALLWIMDHVGLLEPMWQQEEEGLTLLEATSTINHAPHEGIDVWAPDKVLKGYT